MNTKNVLTINRDDILFERFGDEVVAINNKSGHYYSLNRVSSYIWSLLELGATPSQVVQSAVNRFEGDEEHIKASVGDFLRQLVEQELVRVISGPLNREGGSITEPVNKSAFEEPTLEVYSDMQDLLLLDPIHEVDETGWPNKPKEA